MQHAGDARQHANQQRKNHSSPALLLGQGQLPRRRRARPPVCMQHHSVLLPARQAPTLYDPTQPLHWDVSFVVTLRIALHTVVQSTTRTSCHANDSTTAAFTTITTAHTAVAAADCAGGIKFSWQPRVKLHTYKQAVGGPQQGRQEKEDQHDHSASQDTPPSRARLAADHRQPPAASRRLAGVSCS